MASSMYSINYDYNQYINHASDLESAAKKLDRLSDNLTNTIRTIKNNWQAEASGEFQTKCIRERDKINKLSQDLRDTANAIRQMAREIKRAEVNAYNIAQRQEESDK